MNAKLVECALLSPIQHVPIVFKIPPVTPRLRKSNVEIQKSLSYRSQPCTPHDAKYLKQVDF